MTMTDKQIIITRRTERTFDVGTDGRLADQLGWDEMLGLVASLTMPDKRPCLHWLKTEEQRVVKAATNEEVQPSRAFELTDRLLAELRERFPGHELSVVQVPLWVHVRVGGERFTTYVLKSDGDEEVIQRVVEYFERPVRTTGSEYERVTTTPQGIRYRDGLRRWVPDAKGKPSEEKADRGAGDDYPVTGI